MTRNNLGRVALGVLFTAVALTATVAVAAAASPGDPAAPQGLPSVTLTPITTSVSSPVHVTNAHDGSGRLFVVEQGGFTPSRRTARRFRRRFSTSPLSSYLLRRARPSVGRVPSELSSNGFFYVYYVNRLVSPGDITVARYSVSTGDPNVADPNSAVILLVIPHPTNTNHYGGQLFFGPKTAISTPAPATAGPGGDPPNNAQNLDRLLGKILRIDVDGTGDVPCGQADPAPYAIPSSNPFVGTGHCEEIWAYGVAESVALLVRSLDFRPAHRRRRPELLRGDRLPAVLEPGRRELRLAHHGRLPLLQPADPAAIRPA